MKKCRNVNCKLSLIAKVLAMIPAPLLKVCLKQDSSPPPKKDELTTMSNFFSSLAISANCFMLEI
jgi:hypothetical protein